MRARTEFRPTPAPRAAPGSDRHIGTAAGEHTIEEHPATVVGAHLSGLRAARKVHKRYQTTLSQGSGASPDGAAASSSANGGGRTRR